MISEFPSPCSTKEAVLWAVSLHGQSKIWCKLRQEKQGQGERRWEDTTHSPTRTSFLGVKYQENEYVLLTNPRCKVEMYNIVIMFTKD